MALRSILRKSAAAPPSRYKAWVKMMTDKAKTTEDHVSVSALSTLMDHYAVGIPEDEVKSKNNFEVNWEDWKHLHSSDIVEKLQAKVNAINSEEYETEGLVHEVISESENLKNMGKYIYYNASLHLTYICFQDELVENIYHARPMQSLNYWEIDSMFRHSDLASRWDKELGWYMPNNDETDIDFAGANLMQFSKDYYKSASNRYFYDYLGRIQYLCTTSKLSGVERDE